MMDSTTVVTPFHHHHSELLYMSSAHPQGLDTSFENAPMMAAPMPQQMVPQPVNNTPPAPSRARQSPSQQELDMEAQRNQTEALSKSLAELARKVREDENSAQAERSRQMFAIKWLNTSVERCNESNAAIQREMVWQRYETFCKHEKIKNLNMASFGKIVRMVFPDIKTRRLGMRGHSKYHYCGIRFKPETSAFFSSASDGDMAFAVSRDTVRVLNAPNGTNFALTATPGAPTENISPTAEFLQNDINFFTPDSKYVEDVVLPPLEDFVPIGTSPEAIAALAEEYRKHCSESVTAVRFMHLNKFITLSKTLLSRLSDKARGLFTDPAVSQWIFESDWVTFQHCITLFDQLTYEVIPMQVVMTFRNFVQTFPDRIRKHFAGVNEKIVDAKVQVATLFCSLLDRMLRANDSCHAAMRLLTSEAERIRMIDEYRRFIKVTPIVEREAPCSPRLAHDILAEEIPNLLQSPDEVFFSNMVEFIVRLPGRFPGISPRVFILVLGAIESAVLSDLTMHGGESFGSWHILRLWIDELLRWKAESGGFLAHKYTVQAPGGGPDSQMQSSGDDLSDGQTSNNGSPAPSQ